MVRKTNYDAVLPATRATTKMRDRVLAVAGAAGVDMADVIRDCVMGTLPAMEIQLGLVDLDELEDDELAALGVERATEPAVEDRAAGCFGGPPSSR